MKQKKDGRYMTVFADDRILTVFEEVADIKGKTKTRLLEEAMARTIYEYCKENPVSDLSITKIEAKYEGTPCYILKECCPKGSSYMVIETDTGLVTQVLGSKVEIQQGE